MEITEKFIVTIVGIVISAILAMLLIYSFETQIDPAVSYNRQLQTIDRINKSTWECDCGTVNYMENDTCSSCGHARPQE